MVESGIQSAKSILDDERPSIRPDQVLKSLGDLDIELETLKGLIHQSLTKEAEFTKENQSLESSYQFSTAPVRRNISFQRSSTSSSLQQVVPSSLELKQHLQRMLVSVDRVDQSKARIYSDYIAQKNQWKDRDLSERTGMMQNLSHFFFSCSHK
jgi:DNA helicase IV